MDRRLYVEELNLSGSAISALPQSMANLAALEKLNLRGAKIGPLPQNEFMPEHELNHDDFVHCYYYIVRKAVEFLDKTRREGFLAIEEDLEDLGNNDLFKVGLRLVVEGIDDEIIRELLSNMIEREHDPYKRILKQVQVEAILSIQSGEKLTSLLLRMDSMVNIPDNQISAVCAGINSGDIVDVNEALAKISHELPAEREEIRFMQHALTMCDKMRREGLLALEDELDPALLAAQDVFEYGISLVLDRENPKCIRTILDGLIAREPDPWKRKLMIVKRDAVLSIERGDSPRNLVTRMLTRFDKFIEDIFEARLKD
ncbi:hypothetical protein ACYULU_13380 [Breznakiellaceae bacterium SP9]